jgi:hypothetical protein
MAQPLRDWNRDRVLDLILRLSHAPFTFAQLRNSANIPAVLEVAAVLWVVSTFPEFSKAGNPLTPCQAPNALKTA